MKNIISTIAASLIIMTSAFAGITPEAKIINTEAITVISTVDGLFESADYNEDNETIHFSTLTKISVIQILSATGELEFQLPVMSNDVQLNTNLFGQGDFKIGFVMEGENKIHYTKVNIK